MCWEVLYLHSKFSGRLLLINITKQRDPVHYIITATTKILNVKTTAPRAFTVATEDKSDKLGNEINNRSPPIFFN
jgi:hypothetical protein